MPYIRWVAGEPHSSYASVVVRSWVNLIWSSLGVAVVAAAAQLGVAEALDILRWRDHYAPSGGDSWSALLTWVAFIYALSVLGGAVAGRRATHRRGRTDSVFARIAAGLAAAVGATAAIPLAMLHARTAVPAVNVHPELQVLVIAGAGVLAGLVLAVFALFVPPVAGGVRAMVAYVWLAAIGSAVAGVVSNRPYAAPSLAIIDTPALSNLGWWPGAYTMVIAAGLLGLGVALVARWGGVHRVGVAFSGLAGPALVAAAYAIAGPDFTDQTFLASLYAVGAGLLAAALVALPSREAPREETGPADPLWGEDDRYRPGNYLAEARPGEIIGSPFRVPTSTEPLSRRAATPPHPADGPEPARAGAHRAQEAGRRAVRRHRLPRSGVPRLRLPHRRVPGGHHGGRSARPGGGTGAADGAATVGRGVRLAMQPGQHVGPAGGQQLRPPAGRQQLTRPAGRVSARPRPAARSRPPRRRRRRARTGRRCG